MANCFIREQKQSNISGTVHGVYSLHIKLQGKGNDPLHKYIILGINKHHKSSRIVRWWSAQQISLQQALFNESTEH